MVSIKTLAPAAILLTLLNFTSAAPVATIQATVSDDRLNATTTLEARGAWPKRGLPFNNPPTFIRKFNGGGSQVNWAYNWESAMAPDFPGYLEFVPMLWGGGGDKTGPWAGNVNNALSRGTGHLMAFNEPDKCFWGASCMSPQNAVDVYRQHMMPFAKRASLGAPAVTSDQSGGLVGLNWLKEFLNKCQGCKIDFVPIHWYGGCDQQDNFRSHVQNARDIAGGKPIWITEFKAFGNKQQQADFLRRNMAWLDKQPYVARYSWFAAMPNTDPYAGTLVMPSGGGLSNLGKVYTYNKHS